MAKTNALSIARAKKIVSELEKIEELKKEVLRLLPNGIIPYGSKLWWEKEELMANEDIKKGKVYGPFDNASDLVKSLHKNSR